MLSFPSKIDDVWLKFITNEKNKPYFQQIELYLKQAENDGKIIYPKADDIFNAFDLTPFHKVKVVIIGQDPYHNPNQAHGLAFSVPDGEKIPPSLRNIFKELQRDMGISTPNHGNLTKWANQGVLLLNTILTVEKNKPHAHQKIGWETFTDSVIQQLNNHPKPIVYLLWGAHAQKKEALINTNKHIVLTAPHPSPLSAHRGFLGSNHFSLANNALNKVGRDPIEWSIQNK